MSGGMFIETPTVDAVLSLDLATDDNTQEKFLLLTVHLGSGKTARLPMSVAVAMRILALLQKSREDNGWPLPELPVETSQMQ
ncbi:MAG: hypothetical protein WA624_17400 [Methylocella sp.]